MANFIDVPGQFRAREYGVKLANMSDIQDNVYGPYESVAAAHTALSAISMNAVGTTVGIIGANNTIVEYWYQGGTAQANLVAKKPDLAAVATSGSYNDLTDTPAPVDVSGKADKTYVDAALAQKANTNDVNTALAGKANTADVNTALGNKQDTIQDLSTIRNNAELGASAQQPATTLAGYGITDAYTIQQVNDLVSTPHQDYVTVAATSQTASATSVLPAIAQASPATIYRVSNWDGSANSGAGGYDITKYSEYALDSDTNPTQYIFLTVKSQIDEVFDISEYNSNAKYANLAAALAAVPASVQRGGMSVKFIQLTPATYTVVKTEGLTSQPTGTELQSASDVGSGTYDASQLSDFSTLPDDIGASHAVTYFIAVTVDGTTTYTTWIITKNDTQKYVQYRLKATAWSTDIVDWGGVDRVYEENNIPLSESNGTIIQGYINADKSIVRGQFWRMTKPFFVPKNSIIKTGIVCGSTSMSLLSKTDRELTTVEKVLKQGKGTDIPVYIEYFCEEEGYYAVSTGRSYGGQPIALQVSITSSTGYIKDYFDKIEQKIADIDINAAEFSRYEWQSKLPYCYLFHNPIFCGASIYEGSIINQTGEVTYGKVLPEYSMPSNVARIMNGWDVANVSKSGIGINGAFDGTSYTRGNWINNYFNQANFAEHDLVFFGFIMNEITPTTTIDEDVNQYQDYHDYAKTFYGDYCRLIEMTKEVNPNIFIVLVVARYGGAGQALQSYQKKVEAINIIAAKYDIPVIDLNDDTYMSVPIGRDNMHNSPFGYIKAAQFIVASLARIIEERRAEVDNKIYAAHPVN